MAASPFLPLLPGQPDWTQDDAAVLRQFLISSSGIRMTRRLQSLRPEVKLSDSSEIRLAHSDARVGYDSCLSDLIFLAEPPVLTEADRSVQTQPEAPPAGSSR